jgi:hypothetical protein
MDAYAGSGDPLAKCILTDFLPTCRVVSVKRDEKRGETLSTWGVSSLRAFNVQREFVTKEDTRMKLQWDFLFRVAKWIGIGLTAMAVSWIACAQAIGTTTVHGTVYLANGTAGSGSLQLSWPAFTTADNRAVAAGRTTVKIGPDGIMNVNLAPNLGSSPAGLYYTAVYHMGDGTTSTEYRRRVATELLRVFGSPLL